MHLSLLCNHHNYTEENESGSKTMWIKDIATAVPHRPAVVRRVPGLDTLEGQAGRGHLADCWDSSLNAAD